MSFLPASYDLPGVLASIVIASLASYVTLDLAHRVHRSAGRAAALWWAGGSLAMGLGIWAMHFIGMLALSLPIALGYSYGLTLASLGAAVAASAIALGMASLGALNWPRLLLAAAVMGLGICAMHYMGMAALDMVPGIVWDWAWVAVSVAIALVASGVALWLFYWLRTFKGTQRLRLQVVAAAVMGLAIAGMHYAGMAAASFPDNALCLSAAELGGEALAWAVGAACLLVLLITMGAAAWDAQAQQRTRRLSTSLQQANAELLVANEELHKRAFTDGLTRLPNRLLFEDRLSHALARLERAVERRLARKHEKIGVLFVDLDGFKPINDAFGHATGDAVLKVAATRLQQLARDSDTVARVGGDEFLLLIEDAGSAADCMALAGRVVQALGTPFEVNGKTLQIACSVGVVVYPDQGQRDKLVANADAAMYAAKRNGGNCCALFESHMNQSGENHLALLSDLRLAITRGQLALHYQPKVDGRRGQIHGVEALLRWNHPEHGMVSPDIFIGLAERFGLIQQLGQWVIEEACRQMRAWADAGLHMRVSINLSVHQLRQPDLVSRIAESLRRHEVPAAHLLCEITESVAMEDIKATQRAFEDLARIGVYLSIDDFGTGYSSLSYLRQLPACQLKIDRSFVQDLEDSGDARAVVDAVIRLSHALGLRVVAEGVETQGQNDILLRMGCDELQGYHFARPMPAAELQAWAEEQPGQEKLGFTASVLGSL